MLTASKSGDKDSGPLWTESTSLPTGRHGEKEQLPPLTAPGVSRKQSPGLTGSERLVTFSTQSPDRGLVLRERNMLFHEAFSPRAGPHRPFLIQTQSPPRWTFSQLSDPPAHAIVPWHRCGNRDLRHNGRPGVRTRVTVCL